MNPYVPKADSVIPHSASQELLGVELLLDFSPIWATRTQAITIQSIPTLNIPPILILWDTGMCRFHMTRIGRIITIECSVR